MNRPKDCKSYQPKGSFACAAFLGFALVELIVVVAILALLVSVLVPALGRARAQAELVKCRANLKALGLALNLYARDHSGDYPLAEYCHNPQSQFLQAAADYIQEPRLYYCPANDQPQETFNRDNLAAGRIGYFYFSCRLRPSNLDTAMFLRRSVRWPRKLAVNSEPGTWLAGDIWFSGAPTAHPWYKRGVNYLTTDQAVGFVPENIRGTFK